MVALQDEHPGGRQPDLDGPAPERRGRAILGRCVGHLRPRSGGETRGRPSPRSYRRGAPGPPALGTPGPRTRDRPRGRCADRPSIDCRWDREFGSSRPGGRLTIQPSVRRKAATGLGCPHASPRSRTEAASGSYRLGNRPDSRSRFPGGPAPQANPAAGPGTMAGNRVDRARRPRYRGMTHPPPVRTGPRSATDRLATTAVSSSPTTIPLGTTDLRSSAGSSDSAYAGVGLAQAGAVLIADLRSGAGPGRTNRPIRRRPSVVREIGPRTVSRDRPHGAFTTRIDAHARPTEAQIARQPPNAAPRLGPRTEDGAPTRANPDKHPADRRPGSSCPSRMPPGSSGSPEPSGTS